MPLTYESIATQTLSSATASITFSSIPSTYTDLILVCRQATNTDANTQLQFNGDTGSNYSTNFLRSNATTVSTARDSNQTQMNLESFGFPTSAFNAITIANVMNYSNTTTYKTTLSRGSNANTGVSAVSHLWRNTAAITSMTILNNATTFSTGSTFTLYGIKAA
jgi:hypothetical protein